MDGASALGAWTAQPGVQEYLLVSDGLSNYGNRNQPALAAGQRLYALSGAGARTDVARLRAWTAPHQGEVLVRLSVAQQDNNSLLLHGAVQDTGIGLTPEQMQGLRQSAQHYIDNARRFRAGLNKIA